MYPHRIRLRGPWECEPLAWQPAEAALPLPSPRRMLVPGRWGESGLAGFRGRVRFTRRFGYPGRIDDFERVWLTFAGVEGAATVWLNGVPLGSPGETDVTRFLKERNELRLEIEGEDRSGPWGEVALEVRCAAFLRNINLQTQRVDEGDVLHVRGEVVGEAAAPLEIYVVLGRSTVAYAVVSATIAGRAFHLVTEPLDRNLWRDGPVSAKVDLVYGATVWYTVEKAVALEP